MFYFLASKKDSKFVASKSGKVSNMSIKSKYLAIRISKALKYTIFCTNIIFIILLYLSTKAPTISPFEFTIVSYFGMAFPILFLINCGYLLLWIVSFRWKYIIVQVLALALCYQTLETYIPMHKPIKELPDDCFKVMSYNVRGFDWLTGDTARQNPVLEYIARSGADIICMQEFAVEEKKGKDKIISLEEFDDIMVDYPYRSIIRLGDTNNSCIYGLACYSKFPIIGVARVPIESAFNGSAMYEIKITDTKYVTVVNNHLESNRITAEDKALYKELVEDRNRDKLEEVTHNIFQRLDPAFKARAVQAQIIADCIAQQREKTDAMIICGDFNDTPISYAYQTIKGNFADSFKNTGRGLGITYHQNGFLFRIDYIMHTRNISSYNCTVGQVKYSDHYPIWTYISMKKYYSPPKKKDEEENLTKSI